MVSYVDYHSESIAGMESSDMLTGSKTGFCNNLFLTVINEGTITESGFPGIRHFVYRKNKRNN
jgi:hypothetical protein